MTKIAVVMVVKSSLDAFTSVLQNMRSNGWEYKGPWSYIPGQGGWCQLLERVEDANPPE
jgi:hypothetical protein